MGFRGGEFVCCVTATASASYVKVECVVIDRFMILSKRIEGNALD